MTIYEQIKFYCCMAIRGDGRVGYFGDIESMPEGWKVLDPSYNIRPQVELFGSRAKALEAMNK